MMGLWLTMLCGGAGGLPGPSLWNPLWYWDANVPGSVHIDTGVDQWTGLAAGSLLVQTIDADQPTYSSANAGWNNTGTINFDGTSDFLALNITGVPLANQEFLHDCTVDWEIVLHARFLTGISNGDLILGTNPTGVAGVGFGVSYQTAADQLRARIRGDAASVIASVDSPSASCILDTVQMVRINFTFSTQTLSIQIDEGTAVTAVASGTPSTANPTGTLSIGGILAALNAACEFGLIFVSNTIADSTRRAEQVAYFEAKTGRDITP